MAHAPISAALTLAGVVLLVASSNGLAASLSPRGLSRVEGPSALILVQDKPKPETFKHKAKRIWKNLTGYKFDVNCPFDRTTCTENGKNREDARAKCQSQHLLCQIGDAK